MKFYTALLVGLTVFSLSNGDVSHLSRSQQAGHNTFIANDGRFVKQSFNSNGNAAFSASTHGNNDNSANKKYWWINTDDTQNTPQKVQYSSTGCSRCSASSNTVHFKRHDTQQSQQQYHSHTSNNLNGHYITRRPQLKSQNTYKSAHVTGSPRDVNNYFGQSARLAQSEVCTDANSACVAPKFCYNGVIDQLVENKASRSTVRRLILEIFVIISHVFVVLCPRTTVFTPLIKITY